MTVPSWIQCQSTE